jgi:hypothetical protein
MNQMKTVSLRLDEGQDKELSDYAARMQVDKSTAARKIIAEGMTVIKKQEALEKVRQRQWSIWKAASYCSLSYREFLPLLRQENVPFPLTADDLEQELNENRSK